MKNLNENWERTRERFSAWWDRRGLCIGSWGGLGQRSMPAFDASQPAETADWEKRYTDIEYRKDRELHALSTRYFPGETLPIYDIAMGPGSVAAMLGSEPGFDSTVWFHPCYETVLDVNSLPDIKLDRSNKWFQHAVAQAKRAVEHQHHGYLVGFPDLVENIDILASLRGTQTLLMDMFDNPEWVEKSVKQINAAWFEIYDELYSIVKLADGSSAFGAFSLWGKGKTAKVQCDASAMFGPDMFERFVVPSLTEQCEWLDNSMYHLDGSECIQHLDSLLKIEALDAIEWTPDPNVPSGGSAHWYPMYKKIKDAGKSLQVVGVKPHEVVPLLDAVGPAGLYIMTAAGEHEFREIIKAAEPYYL